MNRGRKKKSELKDKEPLIENISSFSDIEYGELAEDNDLFLTEKNDMEDYNYDETDREWMYENNDDEITTEEEDLWEEEKTKENSITENTIGEPPKKEKKKNSSKKKDDIDTYMECLFWFNEMGKKKKLNKDELRYVELMVIELSKFYFNNLDKYKHTKKCQESIKAIYKNIQEAGLC